MGEMKKSHEALVKHFWGGDNLGHVGLNDRIILKLNLWKMDVKETGSLGSIYCPMFPRQRDSNSWIPDLTLRFIGLFTRLGYNYSLYRFIARKPVTCLLALQNCPNLRQPSA
jgi:hypothetical protein